MKKELEISAIILLSLGLLAGCGKSAEQRIAEQLELGQRYLTEGNYEEAVVAFNKVIELDPRVLDAYWGLADSLLHAGEYNSADAAIGQGLEMAGAGEMEQADVERVVDFYDLLAQASIEDSDNDKAIEYYEKIFSLKPNEDIKEKLDELVLGDNLQGEMRTGESTVISAAGFNSFALKEDGTVLAAGEDNGTMDVGGWTDITAITAGSYFTYGLRADGTVLSTSSYQGEAKTFGQNEVSSWNNIAAVAAGPNHTVGLRNDGTVVAIGDNAYGQCNVSDWTDIVAVSAYFHTVGLKADGTVVAAGYNSDGQCDVSDWTDIAAISANGHFTVGLKSDGTLVYTGSNFYGQLNNLDAWNDIIAISTASDNVVGLKEDGTVVISNPQRINIQSLVDSENRLPWNDIRAVSVGITHLLGLKADGTLLTTPCSAARLDFGQCDVDGWSEIKMPYTPK